MLYFYEEEACLLCISDVTGYKRNSSFISTPDNALSEITV